MRSCKEPLRSASGSDTRRRGTAATGTQRRPGGGHSQGKDSHACCGLQKLVAEAAACNDDIRAESHAEGANDEVHNNVVCPDAV